MRRLFLLVAFASASAFCGEAPPHLMIEEAYFACPASKSLQGGIFGKGPLRTFGSRPGACAKQEWQRVSREEFKALATRWHGVDWEREIPFFAAEKQVRQ